MSPDGNSNAECRPADIQLYTWSGPGFESGECWYQGHRFVNGATWGRTDISDAPYCVCEQGNIRIFYSQVAPKKPASADPLTLFRNTYSAAPTSNDLAKWPIPNIPIIRQRVMICSITQIGVRVRSRDGCIGCKCSKGGHWLCRKPPSLKTNRSRNIRQRTNQQRIQTSRNLRYPYTDSSDSANVQLRVSNSRVRQQCPIGMAPRFCILIERLSSSSNTSEKASRYMEIPRETSWVDRDTCTRCACTLDGRLACEYLHATCNRPCLIQKTRPISVMYYFPSGSKWLTPSNDKCRSCTCVDGQRRCINCDQVLQIDINANRFLKNKNRQQQSGIGEYSLLPSTQKVEKTKPCLIKITVSSHRLILPGQKTWFENRCYFCSKTDGRLISCDKDDAEFNTPPDLTTFFNGFSNEELHQIGLALIQQSQHSVQLQQHIHHPASSQHSPRCPPRPTRPSLETISSIPPFMNHQQNRSEVRPLMEQRITPVTSTSRRPASDSLDNSDSNRQRMKKRLRINDHPSRNEQVEQHQHLILAPPHHHQHSFNMNVLKRAVSTNLPCFFFIIFDASVEPKNSPSNTQVAIMLKKCFAQNQIPIKELSMCVQVGERRFKFTVDKKAEFIKPRTLPDCYALVMRYVPLDINQGIARQQILKTIPAAVGFSSILYHHRQRATYDIRFTVRSLEQYQTALELGRLSIGHSRTLKISHRKLL
ncbi:unnamed protein product [Rotaria magnacalcarata]|uniref:Uncharacterized protein n=4 Tax=Rotaria magnacalcarata TaxID=392030 RepID=A0A817ANQ8_9BILA|nr:unnamed protein product [Rotaria magnacalcarata]